MMTGSASSRKIIRALRFGWVYTWAPFSLKFNSFAGRWCQVEAHIFSTRGVLVGGTWYGVRKGVVNRPVGV